MEPLIKKKAWRELELYAHTIRSRFVDNSPNTNFFVSAQGITLDFNHQPMDKTVMNLLLELADECKLPSKIHALLSGSIVNPSEQRPALHTALRVFNEQAIWINGANITADILAVRAQMKAWSLQLRTSTWLGFTGKPITDVVNLGIGGSQLGPQFCLKALSNQVTSGLNFHFISDLDPCVFERLSATLNPETTLFIVTSKSFTTQETLLHTDKAIAWLDKACQAHPDAPNWQQHVIAITAAPDKARQWGIRHVLPIWDWVGGRFSLTSAINFITCIAIGFDAFDELLLGAHGMDQHFQNTELKNNLPVLLALIGIWNNNFLHIHQLLILTYASDLALFTAYVQQLDMESNGKSVDLSGARVSYATGPIIWGGLGNQAQHSYYQLLCQGTHVIAADLVSIDTYNQQAMNHLCFAQRDVLSQQQTSDTAISGRHSLNHIRLSDASPKTLGALISLYEHKIYVQSVIWNINPFDQPGVESAKIRMKELAEQSV